MVGVTLFGIFLTPVFFNVIDWLGNTRQFRSRFWQQVRFFTLGIFALGFLWMLLRLLGFQARNAWRKSRAEERNDSDSQN
jgi:multidrug efflux pump